MKQSDIEIPLEDDRRGLYRFFEILPGALSYAVFLAPFFLSVFNPAWAAYFLVSYVLIWFAKAVAMSVRVLQGHSRVQRAKKLNWSKLLNDLKKPSKAASKHRNSSNSMLRMHAANLDHIAQRPSGDLLPGDLIHAVIVATYNESQDIIHPTVESMLKSNAVDVGSRVAFFLAYEGRAGERKQIESDETVAKYSEQFMYSEAIVHELQQGEITGKGGNATCAGRRVAQWAKENNIDPSRILVTVLDADNRPDENYLAALEYSYIVADDRKMKSYQPIAMYVNNIWDVPAIMRLSAVNNSFFHTANSMRLHALRNFSAHSQSLDALIDSDYWSTRTIVEDGHQFWRMYFTYEGKHDVIPIYAPIYQDAVLASTYRKTMVAQFKQIRRWTYGASDVAYVATRAFFIPNKIPKFDAMLKFFRLLENHVAWATSSLLLVVAGWVPLLLSSSPDDSVVALQLPAVMAKVNIIGLVAIFASMYVGVANLPPKPKHYKRSRWVAFFFQWALIPIVGVVFNSIAAYYSQTRLILGRYFGEFDVTEKVVKKHK